jgi:hypothetical protein
MSCIKRKTPDFFTFSTFDNRLKGKNANALELTIASKSRNFNSEMQSLKISENIKLDEYIGEFSLVLHNLHKMQTLVQAHEFEKLRSIKLKIKDHDALKKEYNHLISRYRKVKGKFLMTPCKIPRSGLNIFS